ncbi:MAG TPA: hypothetical protein VE985_00865 [Gaiellaceae bacterium]|nr:hypothetical protein [Gaiellaceae bacterium]
MTDPLEAIVAEDNHEQAKELLRLLVKDIHVHDRRRIVPAHRVPAAVAQHLVRWAVLGSNQ